jgi:UDP-N-acetylglucosamine 2-epimerase (non-hydrolysing)
MTGQHKETMQDLLLEFGVRTPQEDVVDVRERATVWSLLRWLPRVQLALVRRLSQLRDAHGAVNVVVHGDTLSTVIGAIAGRRAGATVYHLESGLSSGRMFNPFPEELSRRIVFRLADVALCPDAATASFMAARYRCRVENTGGNTIVDSVMMATRSGPARPPAQAPYLVASLHRFQNIFDARRFRFLVDLIRDLAGPYNVHFVLHPATRKRLESEGLLPELARLPGLNLSPRLGYAEFLSLASGAACVLTDGGSNQEELAVLGVPTIVMRQYTERSDGLGRNAIMEGSISEPLRDYIIGGRFESLRTPSLGPQRFGPSLRIAQLLGSPAGR